MKKNWKLWNIFWNFIFKNKNNYHYLKEENSEKIYEIASVFCQDLLKTYNITIKVDGLDFIDRDKPCLFVSNHRSMFDPLFLFNIVNHPCGFFIAGEFDRLLKIKVIKRIIGISKSIYIYKKDLRKTAKQIKLASENIKNYKYSYVVFPEGKIKSEAIEDNTFNGKTAPFMPGAFKVALLNKIDIVPITIENSEFIHNSTNYLDMLNSGQINIKIHQPLAYEDYKNLNTMEISEKIRKIIEMEL